MVIYYYMARFLPLCASAYCNRILVAETIDPKLVGVLLQVFIIWQEAFDYSLQLIHFSVNERLEFSIFFGPV